MNIFTRTVDRIKTMNTKHVQHICYIIWEASSLAPSHTQDCLSTPEYICDQVGQAMLTSNKSVFKILHGDTTMYDD